jgi:hypothetical protein
VLVTTGQPSDGQSGGSEHPNASMLVNNIARESKQASGSVVACHCAAASVCVHLLKRLRQAAMNTCGKM